MPCNQVCDRFPSPAVTTGIAFTLLGDRLTKAEDILQVRFRCSRFTMNRMSSGVRHWKLSGAVPHRGQSKTICFNDLDSGVHRRVALHLPSLARRTVSRASHRVFQPPRSVRCGRKAVAHRIMLVVGAACLLLCAPLPISSQESRAAEYRSKANFLATFPSFVDWPESAFNPYLAASPAERDRALRRRDDARASEVREVGAPGNAAPASRATRRRSARPLVGQGSRQPRRSRGSARATLRDCMAEIRRS